MVCLGLKLGACLGLSWACLGLSRAYLVWVLGFIVLCWACFKLFIPFDGDRGLSIVLSKAMLLAKDDKITDATITSQITRI